jgi:5'-deoxynucleotidase YfbR-like HD superfamily hydrolase
MDQDGVITEAEHKRLGIKAPINYWVWTHSGKQFSYNYTQPEQICIEDIAAALSKTCRYSGHLKIPYPVSDHCCNLVEYEESQGVDNPHYLLGVLLHDAAEAYLGDIPAPAKKLLPDFKKLEKEIFGHIATKFGVPNDEEFHRHLDYIDKNIVRDEAEALFLVKPTWVKDYTFLGAEITVSKNHEQARKRYLELFWELQSRIEDSGDL